MENQPRALEPEEGDDATPETLDQQLREMYRRLQTNNEASIKLFALHYQALTDYESIVHDAPETERPGLAQKFQEGENVLRNFALASIEYATFSVTYLRRSIEIVKEYADKAAKITDDKLRDDLLIVRDERLTMETQAFENAAKQKLNLLTQGNEYIVAFVKEVEQVALMYATTDAAN